MDAIILAAGKGSRMAPLCTEAPKPMLPLAGRPILEHLLERAGAAGVDRAVVVTHHLAHAVQAVAVPDGMEALFVDQGTPRGTGHAVAQAAQQISGDALVLMGDSLVSTGTLESLVQADGLAVAAQQVPEPSAYGVLEVDGAGLVALHEKPAQPPSGLANAGFYKVPAKWLQATQALRPSPRGELEFTDVVHEAAGAGEASWVQAKDWLDIGNPWQYLAAHEQVLPKRFASLPAGAIQGEIGVEDGVHVRGRLIVEQGATVKSGTYVEGDVLVRNGAVVGPNAYLRGPVEIGPGCKVGAASEVKNSILLAGAKAPHHNYVGDSILGHGCNLGAGTKLANVKHTPKTIRVDWDGTLVDTRRRKFGAVIGDGARTGINASLQPGTVLGAGATVPAGGVAAGWVAARDP